MRVREMQTKPHHWAKADPGHRFDDRPRIDAVSNPAVLVQTQVMPLSVFPTTGVDVELPQSLPDRFEALEVSLYHV